MHYRDWARLSDTARAAIGEHRPHALPLKFWIPGVCCSICGERIEQFQAFNWDHELPMSLGGPRGRRNKALAHVLCNSVKQSRHPFSMKTAEEREFIRHYIKKATYAKLVELWSGREPTTQPPVTGGSTP